MRNLTATEKLLLEINWTPQKAREAGVDPKALGWTEAGIKALDESDDKSTELQAGESESLTASPANDKPLPADERAAS